MTVHELSSKLSSAELSEWAAYNSICPIGDTERLELMIASLMALTANVNRSKTKAANKARDFLPQYDRQKLKQTPEQMKALLTALVGS